MELACGWIPHARLDVEATQIHLNTVHAEPVRWLGGWHPLLRQIAPGDGVVVSETLAPTWPAGGLTDAASLLAFLRHYKATVLLPHELSVVRTACLRTARGEHQELAELDRRLASAEWLQGMAESSRLAGRAHLARLQPLRDHRGVRRYREAVDAGEAHGWHAVVAGLALGVYSMPVRQGLLDYARHALGNAIERAAGSLDLSGETARDLLAELSADLPAQVRHLLPDVEVMALQ